MTDVVVTEVAAGDAAAAPHRAASRLSAFLRSIRFRLTAIYSLMLFGLAAVVVGILYMLVARDLANETVAHTYTVQRPVVTPEGVTLRDETVQAQFETLEHLVNERTL